MCCGSVIRERETIITDTKIESTWILPRTEMNNAGWKGYVHGHVL
jgi:hypothetical protein